MILGARAGFLRIVWDEDNTFADIRDAPSTIKLRKGKTKAAASKKENTTKKKPAAAQQKKQEQTKTKQRRSAATMSAVQAYQAEVPTEGDIVEVFLAQRVDCGDDWSNEGLRPPRAAQQAAAQLG